MSNVLELIVRAVDEATSVLENIGNAGQTAGEKLAENWGKISAAGATAGLAIEGYARGQQENTVSAQQLAASLGISETAVRNMALSVAGTGDPLGEMLQLLTLGREQGLSGGEALEEYAGFWDTVADATGLAGPDLAKAGVALNGLGIEAGEQEKALGAFGYITRETTQGVDDFLGFIARTSPDLKKMGLGVDETAGLLGAMEKELGLSGRAARTEFNEAILASGGDLGTMLDILGLTEEQLADYTGAVKDSSGVIDENAEIANNAFTPMQKLQHQAQELAFKFGGLANTAAQAVPVLMAMGPAIKVVSMAKQAWAVATKAVSTAMAFLAANPIVLVILGLVALGAAMVLLYKHSETFRDIVNGAFNAVKDVAVAAFNGIMAVVDWVWPRIQAVIAAVVEAVGPIITNWLNNFKAVWDAFWPLISAVIDLVWSGIKLYIETVLLLITTVIDTALAVIKAAWDLFWPLLSAVISLVWDGIKLYIETVLLLITTIIQVGTDAIKLVWETVWGAIRDYVTPIWDAIKLVIETAWGIISALITGELGKVREVWETTWGTVRSIAETIWDAIRGVIDTAINLVKTIIATVMGEISGAWDTAWGTIKSVADTLWGEISGLIDTAIHLVKSTLDTVLGEIKGAWETIWGGIKTALETVWSAGTGIVGIVDTGLGKIKSGIDGAKAGITGAWQGIWDAITGAVRTAKDTVLGILGEIVGAANAVVDKLNGFIGGVNDALSFSFGVGPFDMPAPIPDIPGASFSVDTPNIPSIPRLATGGMLGADMLIFGHRGEHVINPADSRNISSLSRALGMALDRNGGGSGVTVPVQFLGPVTINATDRAEAERAAGDIGYGVVSQLRRRGVR